MTRFICSLVLIVTLIAPTWGGGVRVVSQTVGTDELLLAIAAPDQIAALSHLARDPRFSGMAKEAEAYPQLAVQGDAENLLKFRPTLVLFADYSRADLRIQVERAGVDSLVFGQYATIEDSFENLRILAKYLGPEAEARAERTIADCQDRLRRLGKRLEGVTPVKVIAPSTYGLLPGTGTTFQDLCDHTGAINLAWTIGKLRGHAPQPTEAMLNWPVEKVVVAGETLETAFVGMEDIPPFRYMPAVKERRAVLIAPHEMGCISHLRIRTYESMARALHPARFPKE